MYLLGIDLETTGLDPEQDQIIEIGAVVWDSSSNRPIEIINKLVEIGGRLIPQKTAGLTGITDKQLVDFGSPLSQAFDVLIPLALKCDFYIGHNALRFDKQFLNAASRKLGRDLPSKPWIDTTIDIPYPAEMRTRKLSYLAADHQIVNAIPHRAAFDVLTMFQILARYDVKEVCERASSELVIVSAKVSFENKNQAIEHGFRWDVQSKVWVRTMRQFDVEKSKFPFGVQVRKLDPTGSI